MDEQKIPYDLEAEIDVLGCIFLDEKLIVQVADELSYEDFYDKKNQTIYNAMLALYKDNKSVDSATVASYLMTHDLMTQAGGFEYLNNIADHGYITTNIETYITSIYDASLKRKTIFELQRLFTEGFNTNVATNDYIDSVEKAVFNLARTRNTSNFKSVESVIETVFDTTTKMSNLTGEVIGYDTGFESLNKYTQGLMPGALIILAARPGMGKSAFAMNLATNVAACNKNGKAGVAIFTLEMSSEQLGERMYAADASIRLNQIRSGKMSKQEWARFNYSRTNLKNLNLYFDDDANPTVSSIRAKCRKLKADGKLDFIVIDYLQLMSVEASLQRASTVERVTSITRGLKLMARELEVPVLALSQLSRKVEEREDDKKRPMLSDLRDSGSIEQDADIVMFLYRDEYYNKKSEHKGEADLIIAKNRSGSLTSEDGVPFIFNGEFQKFREKRGETE